MKNTICPECKRELPYEPSTEAQFCELCGFRIYQPETQLGSPVEVGCFFDTQCGVWDMDMVLPGRLDGHLNREQALQAIVARGVDQKKTEYVLKLCRLCHSFDKGRPVTEVHFRPDWYVRLLSACIFGRNSPIRTRRYELFQNLKRLVTQRSEMSILQLYRDVYWLREGRFRSAKKAQTEGV